MWAQQLSPTRHRRFQRLLAGLGCALLLTWLSLPGTARAFVPTDLPPSPGSYGLEATKKQPAPTTTATISTPLDGASFSNSPITVAGLCTNDLLVQIYDNGVMVGAIDCTKGSFSLQVSLFTGTNELTAIQFDELNQASPASNKVTVAYNNANFSAFGELITLTSNYGRRAANPGATLTWPLLLSGGSGPYAFSIDWGDGSKPDLKSEPLSGEIDISHVYSQSGVYHVTIQVTDTNGVSAYLQVVAVANGQPAATGSTSGGGSNKVSIIIRIIWIPAVICLLLLPLAYWLGRRSELVSLHRRLEKDLADYNEM